MVKNSSSVGIALALVALAGCTAPKATDGGFRYQGVIEHEEVDLAFETAGRLVKLGADVGQPLAAGAEAAVLDASRARANRDAQAATLHAAEAELALLQAGTRREDVRALEAQLRSARAQESLALADLRRAENLLAGQAISPAQRDTADQGVVRARGDRERLEAQLAAARAGRRTQEVEAGEARVAAARAALAAQDLTVTLYTVTAPFAGRIVERTVLPGTVVGAGTPVLVLADTRRPRADVFVPQEDLAGLRPGTPAKVRVDGVPQPLPGRVESIGRSTEFTPRYLFSEEERSRLVVRVRVRIDDPDEVLHAGVPAFVRFDPAGPVASQEGARP